MNKVAIRVIWFVMPFAVISSCGIPTSQFLGPPDREDVSWSVFAPPTVTFAHNVTDNSGENFRGYEIYYKFYPYLPAPMDGEFGTDRTALNAAASGSGKSTLDALGFYRIFGRLPPEEDGEIVEVPPLISIDQADSATPFPVELLFPNRVSVLSPDSARTLFLTSTVYLLRDQQAGTLLSEKTFESDDLSTDPNDPDIPAHIPPTDDRIHMAIVIMAYGTDFTGGTFESIYSDPLIVEQPLEIILQ